MLDQLASNSNQATLTLKSRLSTSTSGKQLDPPKSITSLATNKLISPNQIATNPIVTPLSTTSANTVFNPSPQPGPMDIDAEKRGVKRKQTASTPQSSASKRLKVVEQNAPSAVVVFSGFSESHGTIKDRLTAMLTKLNSQVWTDVRWDNSITHVVSD